LLNRSNAGNGVMDSDASFSTNLKMVGADARRIRIVLIDEHTILRQALRVFFKDEADFEVVGEVGDRSSAIETVAGAQPDIILLGLAAGDVSGYQIIEELLAVATEARVIVLPDARDVKACHNAMRFGAKGVIPKQHPVETLIEVIKKVFAGDVWVESATAAKLLAEMVNDFGGKRPDPETAKMNSLSRREREVVTLVASGMKNRQIAEHLFITEATVSHHLTSIFNKLDIPDRLQLIVYAHRHGLARPNG
jgi:two-component system, NarL family, response regulator DegU